MCSVDSVNYLPRMYHRPKATPCRLAVFVNHSRSRLSAIEKHFLLSSLGDLSIKVIDNLVAP
jgi:hypothetical protein